MSWLVRDENGGDRVVQPWPGDGTLIAHVNEDGTAHDWQAPGHGGIRVPGGTIDPHGHRGGITWPDGRAKYSPEKIQEIIKEGWLDPSVVENDMRSEGVEGNAYSKEETNAKKWGLLNSVVDAIKAGGSKLGDFLYGDTDFGYMEGTQEQRRNAADEARRREFAERLIRERDQSREWRERDIMDKDSMFGVDMWGNKY